MASPESCRIEQLGPEDLAWMRKLNATFGEVFNEPDTYGGQPPSDEYLRSLLASDHFIALVAIKGQDVIGGIAAYEYRKFEQERSEIYIYDLAVAEAHRRQGIATAMIEALQRIAAQRGAYVVIVQADYGDDPAIALYNRMGEQEEVLHFDLPVGEDEGKSH